MVQIVPQIETLSPFFDCKDETKLVKLIDNLVNYYTNQYAPNFSFTIADGAEDP